MMMSKKGDVEFEWIVHVIFYLALLVVVGFIVWALITGKLTSLWQGILSKVRFG
jgi:hypothetical protein